MGTHLRVLSESYPINIKMTEFECFFQKSLRPCALDVGSFSIRMVNEGHYRKDKKVGLACTCLK